MAAKLQQISELSKLLADKTSVAHDFISLLGEFRLGQALRGCQMEKRCGARPIDLLRCLLIFRLCDVSIYQSYRQRFGDLIEGGKNQFYRLLNRPNVQWRKLLYRVAQSFIRLVNEKGDAPTQWNYAIIDDTTIEKTGKKMEQITKVFDHTTMSYMLGYKLQALSISDGKSTLPIDFTLHAEAHKDKSGGLTKKQQDARHHTKREDSDCLKAREQEMFQKKTEAALAMLKRVYKYGICPIMLLIDKWYCSADFIRQVREIAHGAIHVLTLLRDKRTKFVVNGKTKSALQMIKEHDGIKVRKCKLFKGHYFVVDALLDGIPVRLFFVQYGSNTDWEVMLTTNTKLKFAEAFKTYQIRWNIEVLFKECKSYFNLGGCQSTNLNSQFADSTLVFIGYTIIALRKRFSDYETMGELFRDTQKGLLALSLLDRVLPIIVKIIETLLSLCNTTPNEIMERAMADEEANHQLLVYLNYHQSVKERNDKMEYWCA